MFTFVFASKQHHSSPEYSNGYLPLFSGLREGELKGIREKHRVLELNLYQPEGFAPWPPALAEAAIFASLALAPHSGFL